MRYFRINKANWPPGVSDGLSLECSKCGKLPLWDYNVTDEFWKKVVPENWQTGVICFECLIELAEDEKCLYELPGQIKFMQYTGNGFTIEFLPANLFWYRQELSNEEFWEYFKKALKKGTK
jgi:hypothetical protein